MALKNLLRRASGFVTAFALLASMMVSVAGAVDPNPDPNPNPNPGPEAPEPLPNRITVTCYNCSSPEGSSHSHLFSRQSLTPVSVESVYGVHDIDGMTTLYQVGNEYWLFDMPSSSSDSCVGYCPYKIKDVLTAEGLIDSTKSVDPTTGSASVPVTVAREAAPSVSPSPLPCRFRLMLMETSLPQLMLLSTITAALR